MASGFPVPTKEEIEILEKFGYKVDTAYMEVPQCKNCASFNKKTDINAHSVELGTCELVKIGKSGIKPHYCMDLFVLGSFGCVHFQRRG